MNRFAISIISGLLIFSCNPKQKDTRIEFKADFVAGYFLPGNDSDYYFLINLNLINGTDSKLDFMTNSCTSGMNVVWDTTVLKPLINFCNSTYPYLVKLKSQQKFTFPMLFRANRGSRVIGNPIKFGFILLSPENIKSDSLDYNQIISQIRKTNENILWSNPINLNPASFRPWEIRKIKDTFSKD